jgi:hypothetical protein
MEDSRPSRHPPAGRVKAFSVETEKKEGDEEASRVSMSISAPQSPTAGQRVPLGGVLSGLLLVIAVCRWAVA